MDIKEMQEKAFKRLEKIAQPYIEEDCKLFIDTKNDFVAKKADDFDGLIISGYASTYKNVDRHNDVIEKGAFDETVKELKKRKRLSMLTDHDMSVDKMAGSWFKFELDDIGLYMEGRVSRTSKTEHMMKLIEDDALNTVSIGGLMKYEGQNKKGNNRIVKIILLECSIVTVPANPLAQFSQKSLVKSDQVEESNEKKLTPEERRDEVLKILKSKGK